MENHSRTGRYAEIDLEKSRQTVLQRALEQDKRIRHQIEEGTVLDMTDLVGKLIVCGTVLFALCTGSPDLIDGIVFWLTGRMP